MYDYEKVAKDIEFLKETFKNKYETEFKKFNNNINNTLYDILKRNGYKVNIEKITGNINDIVKEYSGYKKFMINLVDLISNAKYSNWSTDNIEYEIEQIKQRMKRMSLLDSFNEIKRNLSKLPINERLLDEIIYDTKNSFNKLCDQVMQLNEELINETKNTLTKNMINTESEQQLTRNKMFNNSDTNVINNIKFGYDAAYERCIKAFEMFSNGQMSTEQVIAFLENEFTFLKPEEIRKIIINLEWELPDNNKELSDFLKNKKEEIKAISNEENKKDGLASAFL